MLDQLMAIIVLPLSIGIAAIWMRCIYKLPWVSNYHSQKPIDAWLMAHVVWGGIYYLILRWLGLTSVALTGAIIVGTVFELFENSEPGIALIQWLGDGRFRGDSVANAVVDINAVAVGGGLACLVCIV